MERRSSSLPLFQVRADPVAMALVCRESGELLLALGAIPEPATSLLLGLGLSLLARRRR